jgi:hypothetical protein
MQDFMPHFSHTDIFTYVSGALGGVEKYVKAKLHLLAITLPHLTTDILNAAASATDGYVVEKVLDNLLAKRNKYNKENRNKVVGIALGAGLVYGNVKLYKKQNMPELSN